MRSTKTLTIQGTTYTTEFRDYGDAGFLVLGMTVEAAGQVIDLFRDAPKGWTEEAVDSWFMQVHPNLSRMADDVFEHGEEVFCEVERVRR